MVTDMTVRSDQAQMEVCVSRLGMISRVFESAAHSPDRWEVSFDGSASVPLAVDLTSEDGDLMVEFNLRAQSSAQVAEILHEGSPIFSVPGPFRAGRPVLVSIAVRVPLSIG